MDAVRDWALSVCAASVCGGIVYLLSPSGSLEKVLKIAVSVFFLTCLLSPVITDWRDININGESFSISQDKNAQEYQNIYQHQVLEECRKSIRKLTYDILAENSLAAQKIEAIINIGGDNSIIIKQIELYMDEAYENQKEKIEKIIEDELGVFPIVIFVEENTYEPESF